MSEPLSKGIVRYSVGDDGEIMRQLPSGQVSFSDSLLDSMRDAHEFERAGYEVLFNDEPLLPKTGFLGWLVRVFG